MPIRLDSRSADFSARFAALLATKREVSEDVEQAVRGIIAEVRKSGDRALIELTKKFDRVNVGGADLRVTADEIRSASSSAIAGVRSRRSGCMCRAAPRPIRHRC